MTQKIITQLFTYPIKSLGGIALPEIKTEIRGLQYDRRWMLIDQEGVFLSQREFPKMALLRPEISSSDLWVRPLNNEQEIIEIPLAPPTPSSPIQVRIWNDFCQATLVGPKQDEWFSDFLGTSCRLVFMPDHSHRPVNPKYAHEGEQVSFADGYPYLIIGESSLADLNQRLEEPVPMNRFRPNIVFSGGLPFEEDQWTNFKIGNTSFRGIKPCARCQITTIDQGTAQVGKEPLRTLAQYRRKGNGVVFGQNACWMPKNSEAESIKIGDILEADC